MEVIALKAGFFDGAPKAPGERFEVPDGRKAQWYAPADSAVARAKLVEKPKGQKPQGLAQMGKEDAKSFIEAHVKGDLA